jgi:hypothetical protein
MPEGSVLVAFHGEGLTGAIEISILDSFYDENLNESRERFVGLGRHLHSELGASRTIMDWGLHRQGFRWQDEVERLASGEIAGKYEILDIRDAEPGAV